MCRVAGLLYTAIGGTLSKIRRSEYHLTISYHQSLDAWFICAGQPYQVKTAPQSVFERFVNASVPTAWGSEALGLYVALESTESDEAERQLCRWYTLCGLLKCRRVRLYASRDEALLAVAKSESDTVAAQPLCYQQKN